MEVARNTKIVQKRSHTNFQYLVLWVTSCISKIPELQLDCRDLRNWAIRSPTRCMCTVSQQINIWIWNVRSWIKGWQKTITQINLKRTQFYSGLIIVTDYLLDTIININDDNKWCVHITAPSKYYCTTLASKYKFANILVFWIGTKQSSIILSKMKNYVMQLSSNNISFNKLLSQFKKIIK